MQVSALAVFCSLLILGNAKRASKKQIFWPWSCFSPLVIRHSEIVFGIVSFDPIPFLYFLLLIFVTVFLVYSSTSLASISTCVLCSHYLVVLHLTFYTHLPFVSSHEYFLVYPSHCSIRADAGFQFSACFLRMWTVLLGCEAGRSVPATTHQQGSNTDENRRKRCTRWM